MAEATTSHGVAFAIGDGEEAETFAPIGLVQEINPPELASQFVENTAHSSAWRTRIWDGVLELEDFEVVVSWDSSDTQHAALETAYMTKTLDNYQFTHTETGAAVWTFAAYVGNLKIETPNRGENKATITMVPTGTLTTA